MTCDRKGRPALSRSGRRAGARHRCGHSAGIAPTARDQGWRRSAFAFRSGNRPHPQERGTTLIETCITLDWRSPKDMGGLSSAGLPLHRDAAINRHDGAADQELLIAGQIVRRPDQCKSVHVSVRSWPRPAPTRPNLEGTVERLDPPGDVTTVLAAARSITTIRCTTTTSANPSHEQGERLIGLQQGVAP